MSLKNLKLREELGYLTEKQQLPILLFMFAFWIVCAAEWTQRFLGANPDPRFWTLLSLIITAYGGFQVFRLRTRIGTRASSAARESKVSRILEQIRGKGFVAFHDLPGASRPVNHVVIGPSGVYAIETQIRSGAGTIEHSGEEELVFGGRIKDGWPLRNARESAAALQRRLDETFEGSYGVKPLLVFVGAWQVRRRGEFGVDVITADQLVEYFDQQRPALTGKEIAALSNYFRGIGTVA